MFAMFGLPVLNSTARSIWVTPVSFRRAYLSLISLTWAGETRVFPFFSSQNLRSGLDPSLREGFGLDFGCRLLAILQFAHRSASSNIRIALSHRSYPHRSHFFKFHPPISRET